MRSAACAVVVSADADVAVGVATPYDSIALSGALSFIFAAELCGSFLLSCALMLSSSLLPRAVLCFSFYLAPEKKEIC